METRKERITENQANKTHFSYIDMLQTVKPQQPQPSKQKEEMGRKKKTSISLQILVLPLCYETKFWIVL